MSLKAATEAALRRAVVVSIALTAVITAATGQTRPLRYALILQDPPVLSHMSSRMQMQSAQVRTERQQLEVRHRALQAQLRTRKIQSTGAVSTVLNAVFVIASPDHIAELKALPGVKAVVPLHQYRRKLNRAEQLLNAPAAWNALGGADNAGAGMKIAILDSGIDQNHPAFQDPALPMPSGYPICSGSDCAFTNNKVIVARSYVKKIAAGTGADPAADSRPDDLSPRDRDGHGTAVASCAAGRDTTGAIPFTGMAPKAYLGNYKIYGSPEVNDTTSDDIIIQAADDAVNDGMDVISFSSGGPAFSGPLDQGAVCGNDPNTPCDLVAKVFNDIANSGVVIVTPAGNEGEDGTNYPTFGTIGSPASAPAVIAVGAVTNSHVFVGAVRVAGANVPANVQNIAADAGDSNVPPGAVSAPLRDVTQVGDNGYGCSPFPQGSLVGTIALIERGPADNACSFDTKVSNAEDAGAVGVILYMEDSSPIIAPGGLTSAYVPAVMISNADAAALKSYIAANPGQTVTIDPTGVEQNATPNLLAGFSSRGPATGTGALKPDLLAVGTSVYMAAENYDPLGILYSSTGYASADGTSFSTPLVAGAAALVKQKHPNFGTAQIKSALVNTATRDVTMDDQGMPVDILSVGGGKLDAGAAVNTAVTAAPASLSYGFLNAGGSFPQTIQLQLTNVSAGGLNLTLAVAANQSPGSAQLTLSKSGMSLAPGASDTVAVSLGGSMPSAGAYSGAVTVQGAGVSLRVPYLFVVSDGAAANIIPLTGTGFDGTVGQQIPDGILSIRLVDQYGAPIANAPVRWTPRGGGTISQADSTTDTNGIAAAVPVLGSVPGSYSYTATAGGLRTTFSGTARSVPNIPANAIANAASFENTKPVAPGSYISIFGTDLSDFTDNATTSILPLAIDYVNVSFDVPGAGISVPGRLIYVSPTQINVQVPWELQGQTSAEMKVTIDYTVGNVVTIPLSTYSPAFFEVSPGTAAALDSSFRPITATNGAKRGTDVLLYVNGLGPVTNQPATGEPAVASNLANTTAVPEVTIGGQSAPVSFSGLAPGFPGLYQVNVTVPPGIAAGTQPVTLTIGGVTARTSNIQVQ